MFIIESRTKKIKRGNEDAGDAVSYTHLVEEFNVYAYVKQLIDGNDVSVLLGVADEVVKVMDTLKSVSYTHLVWQS